MKKVNKFLLLTTLLSTILLLVNANLARGQDNDQDRIGIVSELLSSAESASPCVVEIDVEIGTEGSTHYYLPANNPINGYTIFKEDDFLTSYTFPGNGTVSFHNGIDISKNYFTSYAETYGSLTSAYSASRNSVAGSMTGLIKVSGAFRYQQAYVFESSNIYEKYAYYGTITANQDVLLSVSSPPPYDSFTTTLVAGQTFGPIVLASWGTSHKAPPGSAPISNYYRQDNFYEESTQDFVVTCQVIESGPLVVQPCIEGAYFIKDIPVRNRYDAETDWSDSGTNGTVRFNLNGMSTVYSATPDTVSQFYDMGSDLNYSLTGTNTPLTVRALNNAGIDIANSPQTRKLVGVTAPTWLEGFRYSQSGSCETSGSKSILKYEFGVSPI